MRHIYIMGVLAILCTSTMAMASSQNAVPVREGEPIAEVVPKRTLPANSESEGVPVPVGMAFEPITPAENSTHRVEFTGGLVPVDENAEPTHESAVLSGNPPIPMEDFYTAVKNETLQISADAGVLSNDFDPEGDGLTVTLITNGVDHGSLSLFQSGNFVYTPDSGYVGYDSFDLRISDGTNGQETNRVHLQIVDVDRPPVAQNEFFLVPKNGELIIPAEAGLLLNDFDPDGDSVVVSLISNSVDHGSILVFPDGRFSYYPDTNFTGTDSFTYRIAANGESSTAVGTITVFEPNREPYAENDNYYVPMNGSLSVLSLHGLLRNDFDPDGDSISVNLISNGADHGSLSVFQGGNFNYSPDSWFSGIDAFTYRMGDANGGYSSTTVTIFVGVENNPASSVEKPVSSRQFGMSPPVPNPFNPTTQIDFRIDGTAHTSLRIFDVRGFLVKTLIDEELPVGNHSVHWDGTDDGGGSMASGTYFASLTNGSDHASQRLALVK